MAPFRRGQVNRTRIAVRKRKWAIFVSAAGICFDDLKVWANYFDHAISGNIFLVFVQMRYQKQQTKMISHFILKILTKNNLIVFIV